MRVLADLKFSTEWMKLPLKHIQKSYLRCSFFMDRLHKTKHSELIEIDEGIQLHIAWAQKVFRYIVLKQPSDPQFASQDSHLLCNFGKWFQLNRFRFEKISSEKTQKLEKVHYLVHRNLHKLFSKLSENQQIEPDLVDEYQKNQSELIDLLSYFRTHFISEALQYDPLTGLPLRFGLADKFNYLSHHATKNQKILAIGLLDLDHFKVINDQYGHQAGDEVLVHTAQLMGNSIRETDSIFRFGGEEFLIFLEVENVDSIYEITERISQSLHTHPTILKNGEAVYITATIGIVIVGHHETLEKVIERADQAMYVGKQQGRDRAVFA